MANPEKTARLASIICASSSVFMRLPKQNAFLCKKKLAMGCLVCIVETINTKSTTQKHHEKHSTNQTRHRYSLSFNLP